VFSINHLALGSSMISGLPLEEIPIYSDGCSVT